MYKMFHVTMAVALLARSLAICVVAIGTMAAQPALANDTCFPFDGDCDEPNGLNNCPFGTDTTDCSNPNSNFGSGSGFAGGGGGGGGFGGGGGPDSCFPFDGDCDEPNGLNNCPFGTDTTDCSNPNSNFGSGSGFAGGGGGFGGGGGGGPDSCFPFDGDCDEPNGLNNCPFGTDTTDCSNPNSNFGSGSGFAGGGGGGGGFGGGGGPDSCFPFDGDCDEPNGLNNCPFGTDTTDCSNPNSNFGSGSGFAGGGGGGASFANSCRFAFDGDCDEPNGLNLCSWGTDTSDCSNPNSNFGSGSGFAGGGRVPTRPGIPSTQQGIQIQTALNYFGFNAGFVDGQIGPGTVAAIRQFQGAMGYPNSGTLAVDQSGFLLGAFSWASTQGGAAQSGLGGVPLLMAYRNLLQGTAVTPPRPTGPVRPLAPTRPRGGATAAGTNPPNCPSPQNSDGFTLIYNGYQVEYLLNNEGLTESWTTANDGSFSYDIIYDRFGLFLERWDVDANGNQIATSIYGSTYAGPPIPAPIPGAVWEGTENFYFGDGSPGGQRSVRAAVVGQDTADIGPCLYNALGIQITRTEPTGAQENDYFAYFPAFDIYVFLGFGPNGATPNMEEPLQIAIRADDGFGPAVGSGGVRPGLPPRTGGGLAPVIGGGMPAPVPTIPMK